ncbi:MAG: hypothetical protein L3K02_00030 [Thermoplasmata archaeon]|nr:hypothetical protein [Thermoplasmata archaeon]
MSPRAPLPSESRWASAWRIEVDPAERVRRLRRFRLGTALGSAVAGVLLLAIFVGPTGSSWNVPTFAIYIFAGYLFTLSPASWFALSWALRRVTDKIAFDDDGILVHVTGGLVVEVPWTDPDFAVDLVNWGAGDFSRGTIILTSRMKQGVPNGMITVDGAAALRSEAQGRGLTVESKVEGRPPKLWGTVEMRHPGPEPAPATPGSADSPMAALPLGR